MNKWDVFICHASEDKTAVVEPLAQELHRRGLCVWYDRWVLSIGDSLRRKIDDGLLKSRYGIVILSPYFFQKQWPQWELDGLVQREVKGQKVILPVWHKITREDVASFSLTLADKMAGSTSQGITQLVEELIQAMPDITNKKVASVPFHVSDVNAPAALKIAYKNVTITGQLHRYSLTASLTLNSPPDQGRFRLRILWPHEVRISRLQNLREGEEQQIKGFAYRELWLDRDQRIFPGQTLQIIGPGYSAELEYEYDDHIWDLLEDQPRVLFYTLYLEDHLPVDGQKPFSELNEF